MEQNINIGHLTFVILLIAFAPILLKKIHLLYYYFFDRIFFLNFSFIRRKLPLKEKSFLMKNSSFYKDLSAKNQLYFDHRVSVFISSYNFYGRENLLVTRGMQLLIATSAVKLTFGFKYYIFSVLKNIIIYPNSYYSKNNQKIHKGEFNQHLKTMVISWQDFLEGNKITSDNINLGIHEFTHIIHVNAHKKTDINSVIFKKEFRGLKKMIQKNHRIKNKLITSNYFREYAFENNYEFIAVMLENFIETPKDFKNKFPEIYTRLKKMLNFNFSGY